MHGIIHGRSLGWSFFFVLPFTHQCHFLKKVSQQIQCWFRINCGIAFAWEMTYLLKSSNSSGGVHSFFWKFGLYFVYIFIADWNFLTEFCSFDSGFNRNILTSLYLNLKHLRICNDAVTRLYKPYTNFTTWCQPLINGVYR